MGLYGSPDLDSFSDDNSKPKYQFITCKRCGKQYSSKFKICPNCKDAYAGIKNCSSCGNQISNDSNFCKICGAPTEKITAINSVADKTQGNEIENIEKELQGMKWFKFFKFLTVFNIARQALGIILVLFGFIRLENKVYSGIINFVDFIILIFLIFYLNAFNKRKKQAYPLTLFAIILQCISISCRISVILKLLYPNDAINYYFVFGLFLILSIVFWLIPNYVYFEKRKHLFLK